jgi:hypothetical protein
MLNAVDNIHLEGFIIDRSHFSKKMLQLVNTARYMETIRYILNEGHKISLHIVGALMPLVEREPFRFTCASLPLIFYIVSATI